MVKKWLSFVILMVIGLILPAGLQGKEPATLDNPLQAAGAASVSEQGLPTDQIIIKFKDPGVAADSLALNPDKMILRLSQAAGGRLSYYRPMSGEANVLKLPEPMPLVEVEAISAALSALPEVEYAEPDRILQIIGRPEFVSVVVDLTPNDPRFGDQWHYRYTAGTDEGLNLLPAWDITTGSSSTVVAVIDTGILNHADLAGRSVPGYDFISDTFVANDGDGRDSDPSDPGDWVTTNECGFNGARNSSWHGTHVAGTIGAATNNGLGVAGVNWQAKILPVRVLGKCGGSTSDIVDAMRWSAGLSVTGVPSNTHPAQVLNLSLGGSGSCSVTEQNAINQIVNAGATVVIAAGNDNVDATNFSPGNCDNIITVAANSRTGDKAGYSNFGDKVEVAAPGNSVLSTLNTGTMGPVADNYVYYQGTSMATPHVAGVVSLILGLKPGFTPAQVLARLQSTVRSFPAGSSCISKGCGSGIVDAFQALAGLVNFTDHVNLPMIIKVGESLPEDPLVNGDFEQGTVSWTQFATQGWPLIIEDLDDDSFPGTVHPKSGSWAVWLGGAHDDLSYIGQQVLIPAGAPYFTYYHWIGSEDVCGYDNAEVVIGDSTVVDSYDLCVNENTGGWAKHVVNLSAWSNQTVLVRIVVVTDESLNSNLFVDDVSFEANEDAPAMPPTTIPVEGQEAHKSRIDLIR